jgi:hypothetical protein
MRRQSPKPSLSNNHPSRLRTAVDKKTAGIHAYRFSIVSAANSSIAANGNAKKLTLNKGVYQLSPLLARLIRRRSALLPQ